MYPVGARWEGKAPEKVEEGQAGKEEAKGRVWFGKRWQVEEEGKVGLMVEGVTDLVGHRQATRLCFLIQVQVL